MKRPALRRWRLKRRLTLRAAAPKFGISHAHLHHLETGTCAPSMRVLLRIVRVTRIKMEMLT